MAGVAGWQGLVSTTFLAPACASPSGSAWRCRTRHPWLGRQCPPVRQDPASPLRDAVVL